MLQDNKEIKSGLEIRSLRIIRLIASMFFSILAHTLLVLLLIHLDIDDKLSKNQELQTTQIELVENTIKSTIAAARKSKTKLSQSSSTNLSKNISQFIPKWDSNYLSGMPVTPSGGNSSGRLMPFGHGSGDLEKLEQFTIYDLIYKNIDDLLIYPSVLSYNKIEGTVNVQTFLDTSGNIDWRSFKISGESSYLQIYVLRVLKTIFAKPIRQEYLARLKTPQPIDLSFKFEITENGEKSYNETKKFIMGHVLGFHRFSHQSAAQWRLGPLEGLGPLPFININFGWIAEKIKGEDPLAKFISENTL